jgi:hypothetical protein
VKSARRRQAEPLAQVSFRGIALEARHLAKIREVIAARPGRTRQDLAREVCRAFGWRRPSGAWAVRGARQLLVRLEKIELIRLPPPRRAQGRPRRQAVQTMAEGLASHREESSAGPPAPEAAGSTLVVRPTRAEELLAWRAHIERFHYLGDAALVGESLRYVAEVDGQWVALLSWGAAALRNGPRDRYLEWDEQAKKARLNLIVNNARFLMLRHQPHLASRVLGANLRRLSRDWEQAYGHRVLLAETFVDTSRFRGTCYRASNWIAVGETKGWSKSGDTYRFNGQPKAVWLYPLARGFKEKLCTGSKADPRKERWMVLDVEKLPLSGQGGLFDVLCAFKDPRKRRGVRHKIESILATGICAVLAGARNLTAMAEWSADQPKETLLRLGSKRGKPPSERTYRRIFGSIDVEELDRRTGHWLQEQQRLQAGTGLALDGKTACGSADGEKAATHLLSAVVHGSGVVVGQVAVESKTNEITRVEPLLDSLDIKGVVVTADALHTQKKLASYLVEKKEADYVFSVKDNQPTLRQDIETLGLDAFPPSAHDRR